MQREKTQKMKNWWVVDPRVMATVRLTFDTRENDNL